MSTGECRKGLIEPYGGRLINLVVHGAERVALIEKAKGLPFVQISARSVSDLELLAVGAFSPLDRFITEKDYHSVLADMRLANGVLFPIPLTLPVTDVGGLQIGREIVLRSPTNEMLAVMRLDEAYQWDPETEAKAVLGTTDSRHPLVSEMHTWGRWCLSGPITVLNLPRRNDFPDLRKTPAEVRSILTARKRENVVAYQPRHPMHRAHEALTKHAAHEVDGSILIQPVMGIGTSSERDYFTRIRCYKALLENYYERDRTLLNLIPLWTRMAGPRAGLWHGIINRNYGANHLIIGRDPHGAGRDSHGQAFYDSRDVQQLFLRHESEIGVRMIPHREMVYLSRENRYEHCDCVVNGRDTFIRVSTDTVTEESVFNRKRLPEWFTHPEIAHILFDAHPPKSRQGFCVWLTGRPSSGKSTITDLLVPLIMGIGRNVTALDGDIVRNHLTKGLGFGKEDRITNILRVGFVAAEVVRHEGVAICALISPYRSARDHVRARVGPDRFIEVYVDTPPELCEKRDVKGMYTMAKRGEIKGFTGVDDVYEPPTSPEIRIGTADMTPHQSAQLIIGELARRGFLERRLRPRDHPSNSATMSMIQQ